MGRSERRSRGVLLVLLIFVLVNEDATQISFLGLDFTMPKGVAAVLGGRRRVCHGTDRWRANPSDRADIRQTPTLGRRVHRLTGQRCEGQARSVGLRAVHSSP